MEPTERMVLAVLKATMNELATVESDPTAATQVRRGLAVALADYEVGFKLDPAEKIALKVASGIAERGESVGANTCTVLIWALERALRALVVTRSEGSLWAAEQLIEDAWRAVDPARIWREMSLPDAVRTQRQEVIDLENKIDAACDAAGNDLVRSHGGLVPAIKALRARIDVLEVVDPMLCTVHGNEVHGREAERLRKGIEKFLERCYDGEVQTDGPSQACASFATSYWRDFLLAPRQDHRDRHADRRGFRLQRLPVGRGSGRSEVGAAMIVVKVELWPASGKHAKELARLRIWNADGRYLAQVVTTEGDQLQTREGEVLGFAGGPVWHLVERSLTSLSIGRETSFPSWVAGLAAEWRKRAHALQHDHEGDEYMLGQGRGLLDAEAWMLAAAGGAL